MGNPFFRSLLKGTKIKVDPTKIVQGKLDKLVDNTKEIPVKKEANIPVFPKPERMFPEDARPKGGDYLNPITKESLTGRNVSSANIKVTSEGKPSFKISDDNVDNVGSTDKGSSKIRVNLFKKKAGWKWQDAPEGYEDAPTLVSVEHKGKHFYTLETDFDKGVNLSRYPDKKSEPRLRPTVTGKIELGSQVGTISVRGKEHPVYGKIKTYDTGGLAVSDLEEFASKLIGRQGEPLILDENVGEDTGEVTKVGRPKKRTSEGETVSEKSTTIEIDGKHYNLPSIYGNKKYSDFVLKRALIEGVIKETSVHDSREEAEEAAERRSKGLNQGGTMLGQQTEMAFMNEGGMKDDGGKTEPTSGNKVPSGSLEEEVADDIPAMLSEGEFVFPADVVRYIGLGTLMKMRQDAKQGLKMMEKMGQLGNPEEAEIPDDVPFGMADLVVISGEMEDKEKKAEGGAVGLANGGSLLDDPRFQTGDSGQDPTVYTPEEEQEIKGALDEPMQPSDIQIKKVINPDDPNDFMMWSFDKEGNPLYPIPDGYVVDDTPVEDSYSNTISRRGDPRDTDSSGDSSPAPDGMGSGITLPKESDFVDSDQYKEGQYALYSRGKPIRLQETTLNNLSMEYDKLKKLDGMEKLTFQDYYNLPNYDKARFSLGMTLGRDPTAAEINAAITQAQKSPTGLLSFLNPVVGAIKSFLSPDASGGFTDDDYRKQRDQRDTAVKNLTNLVDPRSQSPYGDAKGVISEADYQKYKRDTELQSQARFPSTGKVGKVDDFLLGVRRDPTGKNPPTIFKGNRNPDGTPKYENLTADALGRIEKNRQDVADKAFENFQKEAAKLRPDIQAAEESAGQGDLDTVAQNQAFDQQMREAEAIARGTPRSEDASRSGRGGQTSGFGFNPSYSTDAGFGYGGSDVVTPFYVGGVPTKPMKPQRLKKGGIASPKAKPKKMKKGGLASSRKK
jgi:cell division septum initiation protein DivIVA